MYIDRLIKTLFLFSSVWLLNACSDKASDANSPGMQETAVEHAQKHLDPTYVCPMHPNVTQDEPGNCPICGMALVEKTINSEGDDAVKISPSIVNNLGVRSAIAERGRLWRLIETVGYVNVDENRITHIHLRTKGWIEKLLIKSAGERVKKGQLLFEFYSPELVQAQDEHLQALRAGSKSLFTASKERLLALGISHKQIQQLVKTRKVSQYVQVYAPQDGVVDELNVREGMYVTQDQEVMSLADLSSVWIVAEVFEKQAQWVQPGQEAQVRLSYQPGRQWKGEVEFVYPNLNADTRTLSVRLRFDNKDESLKPNMFASVSIFAGPKENIIIIPREALIRTGAQERVVLAEGEGRFSVRSVQAGMESGQWVEVLHGLEEGERIVTSGQFLIDSEASLSASIQRMDPHAGHGGH